MYTGEEKYPELTKDMEKCRRCRLAFQRRNVVIYRGNPRSDIMIIGEAPGRQEDIMGLPMVGESGAWFISELDKRGFPIEDIFITNLVYCRPPNNRDPKMDEVDMCSKWLFQHIDHIRPKIIIAVGRLSSSFIIPERMKGTNITHAEGQLWYSNSHNCHVIPLRHPAFVLRNPLNEPEYLKTIDGICEDITLVLTGEKDLTGEM